MECKGDDGMTPQRILPYRSRLEAKYAAYLATKKLLREISDWWYEPTKFDIGAGMRYTPDFGVLMPNGDIQYHEVKGWNRSNVASRMRWKLAAEKYPMYRWLWVTWHHRAWHHEEYKLHPRRKEYD